MSESGEFLARVLGTGQEEQPAAEPAEPVKLEERDLTPEELEEGFRVVERVMRQQDQEAGEFLGGVLRGES